MSDTVSKTSYADEHPEQDPAEGSRDVVDRDLAEVGRKDVPPARTENEKPRDG